MLRELLAALAHSPTASSLEIRSGLRLDRGTFERMLADLLRLGYVEAVPGDGACAPDAGCHGCAMSCPGTSVGGRPLQVTARGRAFLRRLG